MATNVLRMLRLPATCDRVGRGQSTIYSDIADELFPPPISLGARAVGWPEHEVERLLAARITGATDDQIRELVQRIVAERSQYAEPSH